MPPDLFHGLEPEVRQVSEQIAKAPNLAEEALRECEEKYRMLLDEVQDYAIFMLDPQGIVVSWNAGAERIKGYRGEQIIGHNFSCFFPKEDIKRGRPEEVLRMATASGRHEYEGMRVREDGSRFLASIVVVAMRDPAGNLRGFSEISRDLSERKESGEKYRGLLEAAPDAMVVVNQSGEIVLLNVQTEKQFGYHRDELVGQQVKNIIPEGFAERLIADGTRSAAAALAQQIGTGIELTGRRKDGSNFPIEIMLSPLDSAEGILVTAAIRDISVRKSAEKHLAQMEGRYRGLLEAAPDAMVVVNQGGEIILLNLQAEKQFGYHRDELVGQKVKNIIPEGFAERLIADSLRSTEDALAQQIGTGIELTGRRKNGSNFPIEIMLSPLESAEGILVTAAIRDISIRKNAESHLAQMEGRYRGLLEAAPDAMVVVNQGGGIVLLNVQAEKQFGYHRDELVGQQVKNIIPEGFAERLIADGTRTAAEALAQQIGTGIELTGRRKDGSNFPIEIMLSPLESAEGILVTAAIRDISVRKSSEEHLVKTVGELKRSNDELQQFAYVASHDLQEPLRMVASYTQLLAQRYKGRLDSDADEFIAYAVDGSTRMQGLIQDLLAYSRAGSNGKALREISSESALEEALASLRATIEESGAVVTHDSLPAITTDGTQLAQVFQNLVGNAIKYHGAQVPQVHISAAKNAGNEWIFSVRDNGLGIDPQYFDRIFVLFQRLHGPTEFKGTGIGLAICKKMLEGLGGRIWVESQPEKGSTFYFALPERHGK
jgi:PAS domain S-box-containing protein